MLVRLAAIDTANPDLDTVRPVINWRFLPFVTGVASLYTAMWLVPRSSARFGRVLAKDEEDLAPPILFGTATLTTLWILSAEVPASADSELFNLSYSASENVSIPRLTLLEVFMARGSCCWGSSDAGGGYGLSGWRC